MEAVLQAAWIFPNINERMATFLLLLVNGGPDTPPS